MKRILLLLWTTLLIFPSLTMAASAEISLSTGQTIFVPAYSHIYHGNKETPLLLSVTLSIRNTDMKSAMTIKEISYYESGGKLVRKYLEEPMVLAPLAATRFVVPQRDTSGGSGANFIVTWQAEQPINPPIAETVMIGTQSQLGISFTSRGKPIQ